LSPEHFGDLQHGRFPVISGEKISALAALREDLKADIAVIDGTL
jgi:hypothetical protein